jgi:hypothetical protein
MWLIICTLEGDGSCNDRNGTIQLEIVSDVRKFVEEVLTDEEIIDEELIGGEPNREILIDRVLDHHGFIIRGTKYYICGTTVGVLKYLHYDLVDFDDKE